jgi:gamma-glutamylaminecyclotransferase
MNSPVDMVEQCGKHRVFVYGTLKSGQRNFHYLQQAEFVGEFVTEPIYSMHSFDTYPAVCLPGQHAIQGEIYRVSDEGFRLLDELERYPEYYQRIVISTNSGDAWMYVVERDLCQGRPELSGNWPPPGSR